MSKYYRVCSEEQWEWLVNRFGQSETQWPEKGMSFGEIRECLASGGFVIVHNDYFPSVGSVLYTATPQNNGNVIEVSDLMEESKMKDYVTISRDNLDHVRFIENNSGFAEHNKISNVRELRIPKSLLYPKVKFTEAEKAEFDELVKRSNDNNDVEDILNHVRAYDLLFKKVFNVPNAFQKQLDFIRAFAGPSLIEVVPEKKWNVKVPISCDDAYYNKVMKDCKDAVMVKHYVDKRSLQINNNFKFTAEELKYYGLDNDLFEKVEVSLEN